MSSPLPAGTKLGRYVIRSLVGTGGMGEVYLADDTLLRRPTAIKLLIGDFTQKEERLHRFEREAYAASSLNHPNIVTIYEVGSEDGHHFIATEFVDGYSLRRQARISPLDFREVIDVAIQVASALTAAHETGIIHRDIKPENIMLRKDGYVKVLDFGLAKLTDESWHSDADAEAATQLMIKTEPGRVMGTIDYMSPEQARGREVDPRSDIFSLGVVLYELVAGVKPFCGDTKSDVLAAVLTADAKPLVDLVPNVPSELNRIVTKCLRKNREERYQSTKELLVDLKSLKQELEFEAKLGLSQPQAVTRPTTTESTSTKSPVTRPSELYPSTISELFIKEAKTHPRRTVLLLSIIGVGLLVGGIALYKLVKLAWRTDSFQNMRLAKLTSTGDVQPLAVAVSPDGKYVVYATEEAGETSLWVRHVATSSNVSIVPGAPVGFTGLTFSPDGSYVYYIEERRQSTTLYQVPVLGGSPRKLIDDAKGPITFSPDGSQFAFRSSDASALLIANADGNGVKTLATRGNREFWIAPAWSPKKNVIVAVFLSLADNRARLVEVSTTDGTEKPLPGNPWLNVTSLAWVPDATGLVLSGRDVETKQSQLWFVDYPSGNARRITNDLSVYSGVSLTSDGSTLISVQSARVTNLWVAPNGDANLRSQGYTKFQLKVGGNVDVDIERIKQCASELQSGDILIADANTGWKQHEALRLAHAVRDIDVYIEQPCMSYEECLTVRRHTNRPFVLDEVIDELSMVLRTVADHAADVINLKISKVGGLTKARQIRDLCVASGIALTIEDTWGGDIITAAIAALAHSTPSDSLFTATDFNSYVTVSTAEGAPQRNNGRLAASLEPGLGISPRLDVLGNPVVSVLPSTKHSF